MTESNTGRGADPQPPTTKKDDPTPARPSSVFERPVGNVFIVPDDGGSPLDDVSERPTLIAPVEVTQPTES